VFWLCPAPTLPLEGWRRFPVWEPFCERMDPVIQKGEPDWWKEDRNHHGSQMLRLQPDAVACRRGGDHRRRFAWPQFHAIRENDRWMHGFDSVLFTPTRNVLSREVLDIETRYR
jgi:hypothetical protein